jgi:hypothetical protein
MELKEVDVIGLQALQGLIDLLGGGLLGAAIDLRHEEDLLTVTIPQSLPHPQFALPFVVVPGIIEKRNASIDCGSNETNALILCDPSFSDVKAAQSDSGYALTGSTERAIEHLTLQGTRRISERDLRDGSFLSLRLARPALSPCQRN